MANLFECGGGVSGGEFVFPEIILNGASSVVEGDYYSYEGGYFYLPDGIKKITIENALCTVSTSGTSGSCNLIIRDLNGTIKSFSFQASSRQQNMEINVANSASPYIYVKGPMRSIALSGTPARPHFVLSNVCLYI